MGRFTVISEDAFESLQLDAGVLLSQFDPENPYVDPASEDIIATTTGGINPTCVPTYSDFGEDVDNVPNNLMELKHLDGWDCGMGFSTIKFNAENTVWALGAADTTTLSNGVKKITPRRDLKQTDFKDVWWVGDKANGGAYAVRLINALSTGGLSIQSSKNGKGTNAVTLTGHVSIKAQNVMPMEFYDIPPQDGAGTIPVAQNLTNVTSSFSDESVDDGGELNVTLTPASGYELLDDNVSVTMGGVDITSLVYDNGSVSIAKVTSSVTITATGTAEV